MIKKKIQNYGNNSIFYGVGGLFLSWIFKFFLVFNQNYFKNLFVIFFFQICEFKCYRKLNNLYHLHAF